LAICGLGRQMGKRLRILNPEKIEPLKADVK